MTTTFADVDLADGDFYANGRAREAYAWMRANQPVFRDCNGLMGVSTYQDVLDVERNPAVFSNAGGMRPDQLPTPMMVDMDDPDHVLRRKLVNAGFTRKRVMDKLESISRLCDTLIDAVCEKGECDFVRDIAAPLPMAVIGDMLGVAPHDRDKFLEWSDNLVRGLSSKMSDETLQTMVTTFGAYNEFTRKTIEQRRSEPTDDLISVLVHSEIEGQRLSDDDIVMETLLILIGGDETTRHTLSGGTEQLIRHRDQWEQLQNDKVLLPGAVEEMLRWTSPVKNMCRTVTTETELNGTQLAEGDKVLLLFESANFDEAMFGDPDKFRIQRSPNSHLAFGFGTHFCLGNQLARLELGLMTERVVKRLPDLRLAEGAHLPLRPGNFVSGLESMPVAFTPTGPVQ